MADGLKMAQLATLVGMMGQGATTYSPGQQQLLNGLIASSQSATQAEAQRKAEKEAKKKAKKNKAIKAATTVGGLALGAVTGGTALPAVAPAMGALMGAGLGSTLGGAVGDFATDAPDAGAAKLGNAAMQGLSLGMAANAPTAPGPDAMPNVKAATGPPQDVGSWTPKQVESYARTSPEYMKGYLDQGGTLTPRQMTAAGMPDQAAAAHNKNLTDYYRWMYGYGMPMGGY